MEKHDGLVKGRWLGWSLGQRAGGEPSGSGQGVTVWSVSHERKVASSLLIPIHVPVSLQNSVPSLSQWELSAYGAGKPHEKLYDQQRDDQLERRQWTYLYAVLHSHGSHTDAVLWWAGLQGDGPMDTHCRGSYQVHAGWHEGGSAWGVSLHCSIHQGGGKIEDLLASY